MTQPSQKKNNVNIRCSHGENDTHITLYLPPTSRRHVSVESVECQDPRFKEEINKHIDDENFLDTKIGKHLEKKIKPMMIKNGWLYVGYQAGAFYGFDCIKPYNCCMKHIKKKPFWKDMPDIKITKIVICWPDTVGRKSNHPLYGGRDFVLVGNSCEYRNKQLVPCNLIPREYTTDTFKGVDAPAEFTIKYDEVGDPIFNEINLVDYLAEIMHNMVDERVQERVGSIESATTVVPSSRVETIMNPEEEEELPVATEVIPINDNQAIV